MVVIATLIYEGVLGVSDGLLQVAEGCRWSFGQV